MKILTRGGRFVPGTARPIVEAMQDIALGVVDSAVVASRDDQRICTGLTTKGAR